MARFALFAAVFFWAVSAAGQEPSKSRVICDPAEPRNKCPGADCNCVDDVLAVTFDATGDSILPLDRLPASSIDTTIVIDAKNAGIQGWSYGVHHDAGILSLQSATFAGTDAGRLFDQSGFQTTRMEGIFECVTEDPRCQQAQPGGGYIQAIVLSLRSPVNLPLGRNTLARASYLVSGGIGEAGSEIRFTDRLKVLTSPPVTMNLTVQTRSRQPRIVIDGYIEPVMVSAASFHRGDPNDDRRVNVLDAISLLLFLFLSGPAPNCFESADFDDDGRIDTADPILILRWVFLQGASPALPGAPPEPCGDDPASSAESLGCSEYRSC